MDEKIEINGKILQYGVVSDEKGYQVYTYPGMTVAEMAFCVMVTTRLLKQDGYIKDPSDFLDLVYKYLNDPQYAPLEVNDDSQLRI